MRRRTFKEATDLLCLTARDLSELFDVPVQSIRQARMEASASGYRSPPAGWEAQLAKLARSRGRELASLAKDLEAAR